MNLERVPLEEKLKICRKYFIIGAFALPFVWLINVVWFLREALRKGAPGKMRLYLMGSLVGFFAWAALFATWLSVYLTQRASWGPAGDYISFIVPLGVP